VEVFPNLVKAIEFRRISPNCVIKAMSSQEVRLSSTSYHSVKVLLQEKHGAPFRVVRNFSVLPKFTIFWIFEIGFINDLPWDSGMASDPLPPLGDSPFFGYSTKWVYVNSRCPSKDHVICSFIQQLNLNNLTNCHVLVRIWHSSRPRKVGTLIWLTLNRGLPADSLLALGSNAWGSHLRARSALMGFPNCYNTACLNVLKPNTLRRCTLGFGKNGGLRMTLDFLGPLFY
jgi:hypothetical protein